MQSFYQHIIYVTIVQFSLLFLTMCRPTALQLRQRSQSVTSRSQWQEGWTPWTPSRGMAQRKRCRFWAGTSSSGWKLPAKLARTKATKTQRKSARERVRTRHQRQQFLAGEKFSNLNLQTGLNVVKNVLRAPKKKRAKKAAASSSSSTMKSGVKSVKKTVQKRVAKVKASAASAASAESPAPSRPMAPNARPSEPEDKPAAKSKAKTTPCAKVKAKARPKAKSQAKARAARGRPRVTAQDQNEAWVELQKGSALYKASQVKMLEDFALGFDPNLSVKSDQFKALAKGHLQEWVGHRLNCYWSRCTLGVHAHSQNRDILHFGYNQSSACDVYKMAVALMCAILSVA